MSKKRILSSALVVLTVIFVVGSLVLAISCGSDDTESDDRSIDRAEIEQLVKDYAWGVDFKDTDRWMGIWTSDAIYDLSNLGFGTVQGHEALENFMNCLVFPGEPMCFSFISNIDITFTGGNTAVGTDYFIHEGYVPVDIATQKKFSQFFPSTWYLLENLLEVGTGPLPADQFAFVWDHKEGQHQYEFVMENGKWKISYMKGLPLFSSTESVQPLSKQTTIPIDQRPNAEFYSNWLDNACADCTLREPCL